MEETAVNIIAQTAEQMPFFYEHFDTIITMLITIVGFVISYFMTKKNFEDEIKKSKIALASEQIHSLPYDICQLMDEMLKGKDNQDSVLKVYGTILSKVLAYGSADAVKITIKMQRMSYASANATVEERLPMIAAYSLLITQLKFDLTSEIISPESWFHLRMNDYGSIQDIIKKAINDIVEELNLNYLFKV